MEARTEIVTVIAIAIATVTAAAVGQVAKRILILNAARAQHQEFLLRLLVPVPLLQQARRQVPIALARLRFSIIRP